MTKIDERATVPVLDAAARARLAEALDRDGVVAATLFGSQATGTAGPLSDVDVGLWVDPALPATARSKLTLELGAAAAEALSSDEVDIVVLTDAPPLLAHRALRDGVLILERDPVKRVRLETRALLDYLDTAPLRRTLAEGRRRRLEEGEFGRR